MLRYKNFLPDEIMLFLLKYLDKYYIFAITKQDLKVNNTSNAMTTAVLEDFLRKLVSSTNNGGKDQCLIYWAGAWTC